MMMPRTHGDERSDDDESHGDPERSPQLWADVAALVVLAEVAVQHAAEPDEVARRSRACRGSAPSPEPRAALAVVRGFSAGSPAGRRRWPRARTTAPTPTGAAGSRSATAEKTNVSTGLDLPDVEDHGGGRAVAPPRYDVSDQLTGPLRAVPGGTLVAVVLRSPTLLLQARISGNWNSGIVFMSSHTCWSIWFSRSARLVWSGSPMTWSRSSPDLRIGFV